MKKIKLICKTIFILLLSGFIYACTAPVSVKVDQETKDYCFFDQDSYWIFQDSLTLASDSVVLVSPIFYEIIRSAGSNKSELDLYSCMALSYSQEDSTTFYFQLYTDFPSWSHLTSNYTIYHNGKINEYYKKTVLLDEKDSYSMNDVTYSNVKIFEHTSYNQKEKFYWAKHVGIIRIEYVGEDFRTVRNLVRYDVKPYKQ